MLHKLFPFLSWFPMLSLRVLRADFVAGLTGAVIALPQGVAFAMIAGLPPEYGLYSAMIIPVVAALFGSSWHMVSGPATAISIVVFASIQGLAEPGSPEFIELALVLTFLAGLFQWVLGLARMGTLVNFVSHTVVVAFTAGAAILIFTSQMKHALGIGVPQGLGFVGEWRYLLQHLGESNGYVMAVAFGTLAIALLIQRLLPRWPYMLIAMVLGSVLSLLIQGETHGVSLVGKLPAHLPPPSWPPLTWGRMQQLAPDALALALLGLIEAVSIARSIATQTRQRIDGNQEFIGQGLSNLVGSCFSCYAGSGSFTRSGVNHQAGAKTPMASIFAALVLALLLLFVAPLTAYLPIPAMGGIILLVAYRLIDVHHIRQIIRASRSEAAVLAVTFFATLFLELEFAIYLGVILSLVFYLQRTSQPRIQRMAPHPEVAGRPMANVQRAQLDECPQLPIVRLNGSLFFGSVNHVANAFHELAKGPEKHVLILGNAINLIDLAGAEFLVQEAQKWEAKGGGLYLTSLKPSVLTVMKRGGYLDEIGADHFFAHKQEAIASLYAQLDRGMCATCTARIFRECGDLPKVPLHQPLDELKETEVAGQPKSGQGNKEW